jgi:3-hydroxyisobutyrate dehydrogenase-like beta-hydroxyacid dehydrogenase
MADGAGPGIRVGWIGTGRMGAAMVSRLLAAGADVAVYNRTRAKAQALAGAGAAVVDQPVDLAGRDVVFTMVSGPADLLEVTCGSAWRVVPQTQQLHPDARHAARRRPEEKRG